MTAKEAWEVAQQYKKQKPELELNSIIEKINSRAAKGYINCALMLEFQENQKVLESQDYKLKWDEDGLCWVSWDFS